MQNMWCSDSRLAETCTVAVLDLLRAPHEQHHRKRNGLDLEPAQIKPLLPWKGGANNSYHHKHWVAPDQFHVKTSCWGCTWFAKPGFQRPTAEPFSIHLWAFWRIWHDICTEMCILCIYLVLGLQLSPEVQETQKAKGKHALWPRRLQNMLVTLLSTNPSMECYACDAKLWGQPQGEMAVWIPLQLQHLRMIASLAESNVSLDIGEQSGQGCWKSLGKGELKRFELIHR